MSKIIILLAGLLCTIGLVVPASAANQAVSCQSTPCIYDSRGTVIGPPAETGYVSREFNQNQSARGWYKFPIQTGRLNSQPPDGVVQNPTFLFQEPVSGGCHGQPYLYYSDLLPPYAEFDGATFWGQSQSTGPVAIGYKSISWFGTCYDRADDSAPLAIPYPINTTSHGWVPPFIVK